MTIDFIEYALELALENVLTGTGGPFGAVLVKEKKIIATGTNLVTHYNDPTAHAEVMAIRHACEKLGTFQLVGCELYSSCEPCPMCLGAIYWSRLDKVYYANTRKEAATIDFDDEFIYREISKPLIERKIPFLNVKHPKAFNAFEAWKTMTTKITY